MSTSPQHHGTFYGVGIGPGDPDLLTVKAFRLIQQAPVIAYLTSSANHSHAKTIAREALAARNDMAHEVIIEMPMSLDRTLANEAYDKGALAIADCLTQGKDVVFLCEGDPLFFGSFAYLLERLHDRFTCEAVPGISSVMAASAALLQPLTLLKESFVVVSGRHSDEEIREALTRHSSVVIMKAGQARPRILSQLAATGRLEQARYLEYIGRDNQKLISDVSQLANEPGPYFSLFVVLPESRSDVAEPANSNAKAKANAEAKVKHP